MRLVAQGLSVQIDGVRIVSDLDITVEPGEFVGLVGPNGSGKSTVLRAIYRALRPWAGVVTVDGDDIWRLTPRDAARRTAAVLQERPEGVELTVAEVVATGRTPHKGVFGRETLHDEQICADALARVEMAHIARRPVDSLSGGERQRVLVARALAQQSRLLVLDEPTNHLDIRFQLELMELVRGLGITTLVALHDLDLAARYCERLAVMKAGRVVAAGSRDEVLRPDLVEDVFGVRMTMLTHPATGRTHLAFDPLTPSRSVAGVGAPQSCTP